MAPRRAVTAFRPPPPSKSASTTNLEGYPAWNKPLREQYLQTLLTNTFGDTFYAKDHDLALESEAVHDAMLAESPSFAAKALVFARERGYMRTQPIYGLARMFSPFAAQAQDDMGIRRGLATQIFDRIIRTPNDLADFTSILKNMRKGEGGRAVKRVAGKWLLSKLSEYWVIKYGAEKTEGSYSLRDLLQVYHPDAKGKRLPLIDYIMGGMERVMKANDFVTEAVNSLPQLAAFEGLKHATDSAMKIKYILDGKLPHEVATSFAGSDKEIWNAIVPQLPIFALLRNLATLERQGVAERNRQLIEDKLTNEDVILRSKIFPFRFAEAKKHVQSGWLQDALRRALDISAANLPAVQGTTDIAIDRSGSMGDYMLTASIFGLALARRSRGEVYLFNDQLYGLVPSRLDSILTQAENVHAGGGTDHQLVMDHLLRSRRKVDNLIYITDEQQNTGSPLYDMVTQYRERINKKTKLFIVNIAPYTAGMAPKDPNNFYISGWSDQMLSFISLASEGFGSMADAVNQMEV